RSPAQPTVERSGAPAERSRSPAQPTVERSRAPAERSRNPAQPTVERSGAPAERSRNPAQQEQRATARPTNQRFDASTGSTTTPLALRSPNRYGATLRQAQRPIGTRWNTRRLRPLAFT